MKFFFIQTILILGTNNLRSQIFSKGKTVIQLEVGIGSDLFGI